MTDDKPASDAPKMSSQSLPDLERELYSRETSDNITVRRQQLKQLGIEREKKDAPPTTRDQVRLRDLAAEQGRQRRRWILAALGAAALIGIFVAALLTTVWYRNRHNVTADQIGIAIKAPEAFTAGNEIAYEIEYANNSYEDWQNVELSFEAPPGFVLGQSSVPLTPSGRQYLLAVGNLKARESRKLTVTGRLIAEMGASVAAQTSLTITPNNFPSGRFNKSALATTNITAVPVDLAIVLARKATSGERLEGTITITNTSSQPLENIYLELKPADGIQFVVSDPKFAPGFNIVDNTWLIDALQPLKTLSFPIIVVAQGQPNEQRSLQIDAGVKRGQDRYLQRTLTNAVTIVSSELSIKQYFNDKTDLVTVSPGDRIEASIKYANTGTTGLTNAVIKTAIEGVGMNAATLDLQSGGYNPLTKTITWTAATVSQLALLQPQQSGEIKFSFSIHDAPNFPVTNEQSQNNALVFNSTIDSPDVITLEGQQPRLASDRFVMSISSTLDLSAESFYDDGRLGIKSDGPLPPAVGQQTTYTVRVRAGSTLNDLSDVRIVAVLPDGVAYTGQKVVTSGEMNFNDRSNEIAWTLPAMEGLTGRTKPAADLYFQVAVVPSENQRGDVLPLLRRLYGAASDQFTDKELETTQLNLPTTDTAVSGKGTVQ